MNKKVLFFVNDLPAFFIQRLNLAQHVKESGYEVIIASPENQKVDDLKELGFSHQTIPVNRKSLNIFSGIVVIYRLIRIIKKIKPDILHNVSSKQVIYGSIAARICGVKKIINLINGLGWIYVERRGIAVKILRSLVSTLYKLALSNKNIIVIFQNPDDKQYFLDRNILDESQIKVILGSGVNTDKYKPSVEEIPTNQSKIKIIFLSRMLWVKGVKYLIDAVRILKSRSLEFELNLVGQPDLGNPDSIPYETLESWEKNGLINYKGFINDPIKIIQSADVVVLPTYLREGVPLSLIESASCGKPIVTTDVPGCREIVIDGLNGFLIPPKDTIALSESLEKLIINEPLRKKFGEESRKLALKSFSKEIVNKKTLELYE